MASGSRPIVLLISVTAALGGLLFGLDQGFIANALPSIESVYGLDTHGAERYSSILATGGVVGALLSGVLARFLGRKRSLMLAGLIFTVGSAVSALLPSIDVMLACRAALGFAVGIASFVVPLYLSETAPAPIRGSMGSLFQLMITIGIFLVSVTNVLIGRAVSNPTRALPLMFGVIVLFAALMLVGAMLLPESPRWLLLQGRRDQALAVLRRILGDEGEVAREVSEIEQSLGSDGSSSGVVFKGYFLKVLAVGVLLQMFQQLVGINVMIYYAPRIFGFAGLTGIVAMMTVPTVNMLFTFPAVRLVERWGRKKLLYVGAASMLVAMLAAGTAFRFIGAEGSPGVTVPEVVLFVSVIVYIFGFAVSWGPVAWIVCSEIFPMQGREVGMTITTMVNWTFAGLLMDRSLSFMKEHGNSSIFFVFSAFCVLAMLFVAGFIPETKGISLERIEEDLKAGKPLRRLGA